MGMVAAPPVVRDCVDCGTSFEPDWYWSARVRCEACALARSQARSARMRAFRAAYPGVPTQILHAMARDETLDVAEVPAISDADFLALRNLGPKLLAIWRQHFPSPAVPSVSNWVGEG